MTEFSTTTSTDSPGRVVVIGGGPAGLTAAYQLAKSDSTPLVLEKSHTVGGIAKTESYKGYYFDMGGHRFFTKAKAVDSMWKEVLAGEFLRRSRLSRIYYKNKFFHYPLKPFNALWGLGIFESILILASYLRWQIFPCPQEETFEQWVTNRFGRRLFLTFFKTYTEKVWGISCTELKAEWAAQRIKDLSLKTIVFSMVRKPGNRIKTLIEQFDYPKLGPGMMWCAVSDQIEEWGGEVRLQHDVEKIHRTGNHIDRITVSCQGVQETIEGDNYISSMPLTEFVNKLEPPAPQKVLEAAKELKYRDFLTVCLIVQQKDLFEDNWIYIHDPTVQVGRIQNYKNWSPDMVPDPNMTGLGLEYFCNEGDELWCLQDEKLIDLGKKELNQLGLADPNDIVDGCVFRVSKSYPVYDTDYRDHLAILREFVTELGNFQTIGRNGLHRYNNQDHAMLTGMYAVQNLVNGSQLDLWSVNADQVYHEEIYEEEVLEELGVTQESVLAALEAAFAKLDRVAFGMALGIVSGVLLFLATNVLVLKGGSVVGPNLSLLNQYLPGYSVTFMGSWVGMLHGFVGGLIIGWAFSFIRNAFVLVYQTFIKRRAELESLRRIFEYF